MLEILFYKLGVKNSLNGCIIKVFDVLFLKRIQCAKLRNNIRKVE